MTPTSEPMAILSSANSSASPSLDRITMSAGIPRRSCAPIVLGPSPCDAPVAVCNRNAGGVLELGQKFVIRS